MKCSLVLVMISVQFCALAYSTQRPSQQEDESSPFLDIASSFLENLNQNQNGGGSSLDGIAGIASMIGSMMQPSEGGKAQQGGQSGAAQIIAGLGSLLTANAGGRGGGGFDPSMIGNVIQMFAASQSSGSGRDKRSNDGGGLETVLSLASTFLNNYNQNQDDEVETNEIRQEKRTPQKAAPNDGLLNLLPIVMQTLSSFTGSEMEKTEQKHKDHNHILPPFLEKIHLAWDHFTNSELSDALYKKLGLDQVFKGFVGRDGKLDYDKLFESLQNQSFRRRWIHKTMMYMTNWANYYMSNPEVYQSYFATGQLMFNGFLQSQGFPKKTNLDLTKPSESFSNLINFTVKKYLTVDIDSTPYVKPTIGYIQDVLELGKSREYLAKLNTTELSTKLTDTLNLEVIEPILKVHRAYRHAVAEPECDQYVLCQINSHNPNEKLGLGGFKSGVIKFGSYAASWFISENTRTPFWTLLASVNNPHECQVKHPVECDRFHDLENKVTTEYAHTEL